MAKSVIHPDDSGRKAASELDIRNMTLAYFSPTLSTRRIILHLCSGLAMPRVPTTQVNLSHSAARSAGFSLTTSDLCLVAVPAYGGRLPQLTPPLLGALRGDGTPAVLCVVYGGKGYDDALLELSDSLREKGFLPVAACAVVAEHANAPRVSAGRPDTADLEAVRRFGREIGEKLRGDNLAPPAVPGSVPYRELPPKLALSPVTSDTCVLCMQCYRWCPVEAISYYTPNETDQSKCIRCQGCVRRCPVKAREIVDEAFHAKVRQLEERFAGAHPQPELFL